MLSWETIILFRDKTKGLPPPLLKIALTTITLQVIGASLSKPHNLLLRAALVSNNLGKWL
jgi:hypothetical protein